MINRITSSIVPKITEASKDFGNAVNNNNVARNGIHIFDANGFDNSFVTLMTLMITTVIIPRFLMAKNRNPDDKEATKDEVKEVLFRDLQTCTIMLFALKILNSLIATAAGKKTGLPMTKKSFQKVFDSTKFSGKFKEFADAPIEKLKTMGKNLLDLVHPTGGVKALSKSEFQSKYSNLDDFEQIRKMYETIDSQHGDSDKVLKNYVLPDIIKSVEYKIAVLRQEVQDGIRKKADLDRLEAVLNKLNQISEETRIKRYFKDNGAALGDDKVASSIKSRLLDFHINPDNTLVSNGSTLNAILWWIALGIESLYLGFGIPALNQRRLEKKYLEKNPNAKKLKSTNNVPSQTKTIGKLNKNEAKLFSKFV